MIGKLTVVMVVVKDMSRSVAFYRDVLGLKLSFETPGWSELDAGGIHIGLHPEGKDVKVSPTMGCTIAFQVDDIQKAFQDLRAKGAKVIMEPKEEDFGWLGIAADPDGYAIQFAQEKPRAAHH
jgi:predicted enzyme related to lactoylglutathione lyase